MKCKLVLAAAVAAMACSAAFADTGTSDSKSEPAAVLRNVRRVNSAIAPKNPYPNRLKR